jgi:hypothetical protein
MSPEKYDQLWEDLILKAIKEYIKRHPSYEMKVSESKLKMEYMADDLESADEIQLGGGKKIKIDRHKVAALLYLSIVCNDKKPLFQSLASG